jgi:tripartite-type tricarboxylate transporter receptor subunit TctC
MRSRIHESRRRWAAWAGGLVGLLMGLGAAGPAAAQTSAFPSKPLRIVVPYPPGGIGDTMARELAQALAARLGQPVLVDNRPGASLRIGAEAVAKAPPDGHTLFLGSLSAMVLNTYALKQLPYDPVKDFAPVSMFFSTPLFLVAHPSVPARDVAGLVQHARAHPGKLNYGSLGSGTSLHLTAEMFKAATGTFMVHIPYKGSAPALTDLIAGEIQLMFDAGSSSLPHVRAGKLRVLGVTSAKRVPGTPEVPAIAETVPGFEASFWFALFAPAGSPATAVERLSSEINEVLRTPALRDRYKADGVEVFGSTPAELAARMQADGPKWTAIQKRAGVQPE